jgi:hypothetical protein
MRYLCPSSERLTQSQSFVATSRGLDKGKRFSPLRCISTGSVVVSSGYDLRLMLRLGILVPDHIFTKLNLT